jgi:predicted phage terminase large subunit-like protein
VIAPPPVLAVSTAAAELARRELARRNNVDFLRFLNPEYLVGPFQLALNRILDDMFEAYQRGENPCVAISAPPRSGKTVAVDHAIARFYASDPGAEIIHATYSQDFANERGRSVGQLLNDPNLALLYPNFHIDPDANAISRIGTTNGGVYLATGAGGGLTGRGGNLLVIDDIVKNEVEAESPTELRRHFEWYQSTLRTRALPRFMILVIMTRWSAADLVGQLKRLPAGSDPWQFHTFKAIDNGQALDPQRYPIHVMEKIRAGMSPRAWSCMFQQSPIVTEGTFFDMEEILKSIMPADKYPKKSDLRWYIPADFAISQKTKSDFTCIWPFGVDKDGTAWFSPRHFHKKTSSADEICTAILDLADDHSAHSLILEDGHLFRAMRGLLRKKMEERGKYYHVDAPWPTQDKQARAQPLRGRVSQQKIRFPDIPWVRETVLPEFQAFGADTAGVHDDTVDACSTGLGKIASLLPGTGSAPTPAKTWEPAANPEEWTMKDIEVRARRVHLGSMVRHPRYLNGKPRS